MKMNIQPEWLSGFVGVIAPLIVRWITGANLSRRWKSIIAILVSSVIGFASAFLSGQFDAGTILKSIAVAFSISQVFYDQVFKDLFNKKESPIV
jgi:ABC-type Fe3+-siderophore transport system permease subunit